MPALQLPPIETLAHAAAALVEQAGDNRALINALNKAEMQLHAGCVPVPTVGGFLVESRTRGGLVHRVSTVNGCSCESRRECWHVSILAIIEEAQRYTMPALPQAAPKETGRLAMPRKVYATTEDDWY